MATRQTMTISLPPEMISEVERVRKMEQRTRSELVREALRTYFAKRIAVVQATAAEKRAIKKGREEFERGEYVDLDQVLDALESRSRKIRRKTA
jgi:predicted transcriptional regulator